MRKEKKGERKNKREEDREGKDRKGMRRREK